MREIIELNRQIRAERPETIHEDSLPTINRKDGPEFWPEASQAVRRAGAAVHSELNRHIPEDFGYTVFLGGEEAHFLLNFDDGAQTGSFHSLDIKEHLSIERQLCAIDWDEQRGAEMRGCQIFDAMKENAARIPTRIPSTKKLQRLCGEDVKEWVKKKRRDHSKAFVLMWRDNEFEDQEYESIGAFRRDLYNLLAVEFHIICVVADGKPLPSKRIDELKAEALKMMEEHMPISYARATGKFGVSALGDFDSEDNE